MNSFCKIFWTTLILSCALITVLPFANQASSSAVAEEKEIKPSELPPHPAAPPSGGITSGIEKANEAASAVESHDKKIQGQASDAEEVMDDEALEEEGMDLPEDEIEDLPTDSQPE